MQEVALDTVLFDSQDIVGYCSIHIEDSIFLVYASLTLVIMKTLNSWNKKAVDEYLLDMPLYIIFIHLHGDTLSHGWEVCQAKGWGRDVTLAPAINGVRNIHHPELHSMGDVNGGWVIFNLENVKYFGTRCNFNG